MATSQLCSSRCSRAQSGYEYYTKTLRIRASLGVVDLQKKLIEEVPSEPCAAKRREAGSVAGVADEKATAMDK